MGFCQRFFESALKNANEPDLSAQAGMTLAVSLNDDEWHRRKRREKRVTQTPALLHTRRAALSVTLSLFQRRGVKPADTLVR